MSKKDLLVSVILVTFNRRNELKRAIESVIAQDYLNIEILLIDNNSTDDTVDMVRNFYKEIKLIELGKNYGCPRARNIGIKACRGDIIFILDDDAWIDSNLISGIIHKFNQSPPKVGVIVPQRVDYQNNSRLNYYDLYEEREIFTFTGCGVALKKEIFEQVGYFPDTHYGSEENFLTIKMYNKGYKLLFTPDLVVHHKPSHVRNEREISFLKVRNDMSWVWTFTPWILILPIFFLKSLIWLRAGIRARSLFIVFRGLIDGIFINAIFSSKYREPIKLSVFVKFLFNRKRSRRSG